MLPSKASNCCHTTQKHVFFRIPDSSDAAALAVAVAVAVADAAVAVAVAAVAAVVLGLCCGL